MGTNQSLPVHNGTFISGCREMEEVKTKIIQVEVQISAVEEEMRNCERYRHDCAKTVCILLLVPTHLCSFLFVCVTMRLTNNI